MIKAILFDLDGVLLDATEVHFNALNDALKINNFSPISIEEHKLKFNGLPTKIKLEKLNIPKEYFSKIEQVKQDFTIKEIKKLTPSLEIKKILKFYKNKNIKLACCSNSIKNTIITGLEAVRYLKYFDLIISNEDVKFAKPNPEIYHIAMKKFLLTPVECLIVEDSDTGFRAANDSGASVLKIRNIHDMKFSTINNIIKICESYIDTKIVVNLHENNLT